jgi:hypothetical protein
MTSCTIFLDDVRQKEQPDMDDSFGSDEAMEACGQEAAPDNPLYCDVTNIQDIDEAAEEQGWEVIKKENPIRREYRSPHKKGKTSYYVETVEPREAIWHLLEELRQEGLLWPWPPEPRYTASLPAVWKGPSALPRRFLNRFLRRRPH